ncbi:hypothetical protein GCM10017600_45550 [Streptosporangium carneum]|uniref:Uncharacterized protein n=1 Tax=Streptosporangium carneum TaxID=47481 RepID=A0A9W6I558_9ACTN|nr:hypothetical protein GCM10017600_45550 [Streptosporangium carneum]
MILTAPPGLDTVTPSCAIKALPCGTTHLAEPPMDFDLAVTPEEHLPDVLQRFMSRDPA